MRLSASAISVPASIIPVLASVVAVGALVLGLTGSASATTARPAAPSLTSVQMVVFDCLGQRALVEPKTFILSCADANSLLSGLSWTSWTSRLASATGTLQENDCTPYCAAGHFHSYPAVVVLWGNAAVKNHPGEHCYPKMTVILTGARPRYYDYATHKWVTQAATQTITLLTSAGAVSPRA
jgi:hypothetical protein